VGIVAISYPILTRIWGISNLGVVELDSIVRAFLVWRLQLGAAIRSC
jgi:hypothetical protein